jgi:diaminohydroxyphosphoribosylaminopyrimidine deaminase/5-amino-6-(5-phosphoribosylamino)uracil reductase
VDGFFLRRALELAQSRRGFCSPNPSVGALVVREGRILAEGFHRAAGQPHAEVQALKELSLEATTGATLYVSLEPCCHYGRTPPCTDLIIQKGISEVIYAYRDPNPVVAGRGETALRNAGIDTRLVPLAEVAEFYQSYSHWTQTGMPFTTVKLALSLDGKTAGPGGLPLPLTGPEANRFTHERRLRSDAILTTARTVLADDPRLNARLHGVETPKPVIILDRLGRTPQSARIFQTAQSVTVYTGEDVPADRRRLLADQGATVIAVGTPNGLLPLRQILAQVGEAGYHDLWVEGGAALFTAFIKERIAQRAFLYLAPVIVGEGVSAFESPWEGLLSQAHLTWTPQGRDVMAEVVW